jgi:hypothetical protein
MGAGASKEQVYQWTYTRLHEIQRDLEKRGVASTYRNSELYGWKGNTGLGKLNHNFLIRFDRHNASNGECFLEGKIFISYEGLTDNTFSSSPIINTFNKGIDKIVELFGGNNGPTQ